MIPPLSAVDPVLSCVVALVGGVLFGLAVGGPVRRAYYRWHIRRVHRARVLAALRQEDE